MPQRWDEFAVDELRVLLAESKATVERLLDRAHALAQRLPGTMAAYRSGKLRQSKVTIIVDATVLLDDDEAQAAEEQVLGRASQLTPQRAAGRDRQSGDGRRAGQGEEAAGRGRGRTPGWSGGPRTRGTRR